MLLRTCKVFVVLWTAAGLGRAPALAATEARRAHGNLAAVATYVPLCRDRYGKLDRRACRGRRPDQRLVVAQLAATSLCADD